jgi:hypothetical protein
MAGAVPAGHGTLKEKLKAGLVRAEEKTEL